MNALIVIKALGFLFDAKYIAGEVPIERPKIYIFLSSILNLAFIKSYTNVVLFIISSADGSDKYIE